MTGDTLFAFAKRLQKGVLILFLVAKRDSQKVVTKEVSLVHRFQKGIAADTFFEIAKRAVHIVSSCKKGTMAMHSFRRGE